MTDSLDHLIADCRAATHGYSAREGPNWSPSDFAEVGEALEELKHLRELSGKMFKTADGVPLVKGMIVYWISEDGGYAPAPRLYMTAGIFDAEKCFSSGDAARASRINK